jgi:hypothetical protein
LAPLRPAWRTASTTATRPSRPRRVWFLFGACQREAGGRSADKLSGVCGSHARSGRIRERRGRGPSSGCACGWAATAASWMIAIGAACASVDFERAVAPSRPRVSKHQQPPCPTRSQAEAEAPAPTLLPPSLSTQSRAPALPRGQSRQILIEPPRPRPRRLFRDGATTTATAKCAGCERLPEERAARRERRRGRRRRPGPHRRG